MADRKNNTKVFSLHDKLIRDVYGDRDNAHSFLSNNLPEKLRKEGEERGRLEASGKR